jgi:uncharacterized membrane protein YfcA
MGNLEMWAAIVGFLLPPVMAILQQTKFDTALKAILAFIACLAVSVPTVYLQGSGDFTWERWSTALLTILTTAMATYHGFWKPTNVAPTIEKATNLS